MEANFARYLEWLKKVHKVKTWEHEPETFWFEAIKRGVRSYKPDFRVVDDNGKTVYYEVKGYMDAKSKTKLKRMAKYYPEIELVVVDAKRYAEIKRNVAPLIKDWE